MSNLFDPGAFWVTTSDGAYFSRSSTVLVPCLSRVSWLTAETAIATCWMDSAPDRLAVTTTSPTSLAFLSAVAAME